MAGTLDAMNVSEILPFLGHTEQSAGLSSLLLSAGFDVARMLGRVRRGHGVGHLELKPLGIELAFQFHTDYKETYGTGRRRNRLGLLVQGWRTGRCVLSARYHYRTPILFRTVQDHSRKTDPHPYQ